jgi:hypothetical protein
MTLSALISIENASGVLLKRVSKDNFSYSNTSNPAQEPFLYS